MKCQWSWRVGEDEVSEEEVSKVKVLISEVCEDKVSKVLAISEDEGSVSEVEVEVIMK